MSLRAITWAFDQHDTTPTQRLLLLAYADYANADDEAWPSVETLMEKTGYSKATIYRARSELCDGGWMAKLDEKDHYRILRERIEISERDSDSQSEKSTTYRNPQEPPETAAADADEPEDEPQRLYDSYIEIVRKGDHGRLPERIPSGYRKDAEAVLKDWPMDSLLIALRGFVAYRARKPGGDRFSDVFGTHIRQSRTERIEFWITQAGDGSALHTFPTETRHRVVRAVRDVQRAFGTEDPDLLETGEQAVKYLKSKGVEVAYRPNGEPHFPALGGK